MSERFTDELWREAAPVWQAIQTHPFLAELQAGVLPLETFQYYVTQDYHYLEGFGRAVATALAKAPSAELLARIARRVMTPIERPLHERLFAMAGVTHEQAAAAPISPTNLAYQNHMLATAARGNLGEIAAALLPCPWTYHALGDVVVGVDHPVYGEWARFYSEGLLADSCRSWRELVDDEVAEGGPRTRAAMRRVFHQSMRYEWMFWDMAYRRETWPI
ncbi:MAG: TenA family protein [Chloroflexi bacterium]|nr:TenA family protein [Chloroflexota bacterium]